MKTPTGRRSYAVAWRDGHRPRHAGKLEFRPLALRLEGGSRDRVEASLPYRDVESFRIERGDREGVHRRPTLVVHRRGHEPVSITTLDGVGTLSEVYERLAAEVAA